MRTLGLVGIAGKFQAYPQELSGGELITFFTTIMMYLVS